MRQVTQKDIAKSLGLSQSTVGLILGCVDHPLRKKLRPETVERVKKKAEELGYFPNPSAQVLRKRRSNVIIILNFAPPHREIAGMQIYHLGRLIDAAGYTSRTIDARWWTGDAQLLIDQLVGLSPVGIIVLAAPQLPVTPEHILELRSKWKIPVVSMGTTIKGIPAVIHDSKDSIRRITSNVIQNGRRRLALLIASENTRQMQERVAGFQEALLAANIPPAEKHHRTDYSFSISTDAIQAVILLASFRSTLFLDFSPFLATADQVLSVPEPPDALICSDDDFALGALAVAHKKNIRVPDALFISGFNNDASAALSTVSLTTTEIPVEGMCQTAMEMLLEQVPNRSADSMEGEVRVFPSRIIWRDSCPRYADKEGAPLPDTKYI